MDQSGKGHAVTVNSLVPTATPLANLDTLPSPQSTLTFESFLENSDQEDSLTK